MKVSALIERLWIKSSLLVGCALAFAADAAQQGYRDYAPVVNVEPIMETHYEPVTREICVDPRELAPVPRPAAATIGEDIRGQMRLAWNQDACHTIVEQERQQRITGYWVTYRYQGRTSRIRLSYDPGRRIPVDVDLAPLP